MSPSELNQTVAHRAFEEIWNQGNLDAVDTLYADDFVEHDRRLSIRPGADSFKYWISTAVVAFPYERLSIEEIYSMGDKIAARYTVHGCSCPSHEGQRNQGERRSMVGALVMRFSRGLISESWGTVKMLDLLSRCE
jgi:predicted ester cyclase